MKNNRILSNIHLKKHPIVKQLDDINSRVILCGHSSVIYDIWDGFQLNRRKIMNTKLSHLKVPKIKNHILRVYLARLNKSVFQKRLAEALERSSVYSCGWGM